MPSLPWEDLSTQMQDNKLCDIKYLIYDSTICSHKRASTQPCRSSLFNPAGNNQISFKPYPNSFKMKSTLEKLAEIDYLKKRWDSHVIAVLPLIIGTPFQNT